jgi:hypothetical protein
MDRIRLPVFAALNSADEAVRTTVIHAMGGSQSARRFTLS